MTIVGDHWRKDANEKPPSGVWVYVWQADLVQHWPSGPENYTGYIAHIDGQDGEWRTKDDDRLKSVTHWRPITPPPWTMPKGVEVKT